MGRLVRSKTTAWMLVARRKVTAVVAIAGFAAAGTVLAAGTASAEPWNPNVDVVGRAFVCGPRSFPLGVHFDGNTGDRGFVRTGRDGSFVLPLHRVGPRGEFVRGTVDCAWRPPAGFATNVQRPGRGHTDFHNI
jgi:hypothetical protein